MESLNKNGVSVCQAGEEKYVYFNLMPRLRKKAGIANTTTAPRRGTFQHCSPDIGNMQRTKGRMVKH